MFASPMLNAVLGILIKAGFSAAQAYQAFLTLDSFVYGFTLQEVNWADATAAQTSAAPTGLEKYPYPVQVMTKFAERPPSPIVAGSAYAPEFDFGLDLLLDGLERLRAAG